MPALARLGVASALACCITTAAAVTNANATTPHPKPPTPHFIAAAAVHPIAARPSGNPQADYLRAYNARQGQVASVEGSGATVGAVIGVPVGCVLGGLVGLPFAAAGVVFPPFLIATIPSGLLFTGAARVMGGLIGAGVGGAVNQAANPALSAESTQLQNRCYQVMPEPVCLNQWVLPYLDTSSPVAAHLRR